MKALSFKIPKTENQSFRVQIDEAPLFYSQLHYHPEIQITQIKSGRGTRFIGDSIDNFSEGDIYIIGSNIPHLFKSDKTYYERTNNHSKSISCYFKSDSFGKGFFDLPETFHIRELIKESDNCIKVIDNNQHRLTELIEKISLSESFVRFEKFLSLLNSLSHVSEKSFLCKGVNIQPRSEKEGKKMNDIFNYVFENFNHSIRLETASNIANMSTTAFCRYFKQRTRKTFVNFVNEVRIGEACKLLQERELNISEVCYKVGFNNISNFNRKFKEITRLTPKQYSLKFMNEEI